MKRTASLLRVSEEDLRKLVAVPNALRLSTRRNKAISYSTTVSYELLVDHMMQTPRAAILRVLAK